MSLSKHTRRLRKWAAVSAVGMVCQFGGCDIGEITTTVTLSGRDLLINVVRGAILAPLDAFVTQAINDAFDGD